MTDPNPDTLAREQSRTLADVATRIAPNVDTLAELVAAIENYVLARETAAFAEGAEDIRKRVLRLINDELANGDGSRVVALEGLMGMIRNLSVDGK